MDYYKKFVQNHPSKTVLVNGIGRQYLTGGRGKIGFLIFPGAFMDAYTCFDLIEVFESKYKAVAFNYDGFSDLESFFSYVNRVLEREKISRFMLYGLSIGGFLAQVYARKYKDRVLRLIISHASSTKSPTTIKKIIIPGKIIYFFLSIIPESIFKKLFIKYAGQVQSQNADIHDLYRKYSTTENYAKRKNFFMQYNNKLVNKKYLQSFYRLGMDLVKEERKFNGDELKDWSKKILILRTNNDPLAQDDGLFKRHYPLAKVHTFYKTSHLTAFIQFEKMVGVIKHFLKN